MIKYLIIDIDGTLTNGKINISENGEIFKYFSVKDGYAINYILKPNNIKPIVITSRKSKIVDIRCNEIGIDDIYQGYTNKYEKLIDILGRDELKYCAYFGDDVLDLECMKPIIESGGIAGCPIDAVDGVRAVANYVCKNKAGEGAFREFTEWLVKPHINAYDISKKVNDAVKYLHTIDAKTIKPNTKYVVDDNFSYSLKEYSTKTINLNDFESHRKFIDIQIIISGREIMDVADTSRLISKTKYDDNTDIVHWNTPATMSSIALSEGDYIILYPEYAHRGGTSVFEDVKVKKIVGKLKI